MPGGFGDNRGLLLLAARHYIGLIYCFYCLLCSNSGPLSLGLVEPFAPKPKHAIRSCPIILPRDCRGQFNQLWRGEALLQPLAQFRSHIRRCRRNRVRHFQHKLFVGRKQVAFRIPVQVADLIVAQACDSASGRVNVDSKRTFHQLGCANLSQNFQLGRDKVGFIQRHAELRVRNQNVRVRGDCSERSNIFAQALAGKLANQ
jgi:hypothetical protein